MRKSRGIRTRLLVPCLLLLALFEANLCGLYWQAESFSGRSSVVHGEHGAAKTGPASRRGLDQAQVILHRARAALNRGDRQSALEILAGLSVQDGASHFAAGEMLADRKAYRDAAREFGLARQTYRDAYAAGYGQALAYLNAGDCAAAIETANELLNQGYETAALADVAAAAYLKTGKSNEAYNAYRLATRLDPKDESAYIGLCEILLARDNYDLGLEVANIALSHLPDSEQLLIERGVMHAMKGESEGAEHDFAAAAKLDPLDALPVVAAALVSMQSGQLDRAVALLRHCSQEHQRDYFSQYWFAEALLRAGAVPGTVEETDALRALEASVRDNPDFWHSRAELGKLLLARGRADSAIEQLEKAAELNPKATTPLYLLAQAYRRKGNLAKATELTARVTAMQAEERDSQAIPQTVLKQLVLEKGSSSPERQGGHGRQPTAEPAP